MDLLDDHLGIVMAARQDSRQQDLDVTGTEERQVFFLKLPLP